MCDERAAHLRAGEPELGEADGVGEEDAGDGHHRPAAVGELSLFVPRQCVGISSEAERVKAPVAGCRSAVCT